jgi:methionyl aminopeptidase
MKIPLKTESDIQIMREGGKITSAALRAVKSAVKPGITTLELDKIAEKTIIGLGAEPSFKKVPGYHFTLCTCVNDVVVHGVPDNVPLVVGDIVGIDVGAYLKGFHTDLSYSVIVTENGFWEPGEKEVAEIRKMLKEGKTKEERQKTKEGAVDSEQFEGDISMDEKKIFLAVGMAALLDAREQARIGNHIGDISSVLQKYIEGFGYSVVRELIGHGVGKDLHEPPQVPGRGKVGEGMIMKEGLVLAIESIYTFGDPGVAFKNNDGWSIATADYSVSGLYEQSVAITAKGPEVLTAW